MGETLLEVRHLALSFYSRPVLEDVSLALHAGELILLAGRNGAGKTMLAKCMAGLQSPDSGHLLFRGTELGRLAGSPATRVAYLYQDARLQLLGDSALDDVLFGLAAQGCAGREAEARALEALELVGLREKADALPWQLSGGEQRRLAIAGVLVLEPSVLILDEPLANLDWASVASVLSILDRLRRGGKGILVLTHELDKLLGMADRLIILDAGRIVAEGEPGPLLKRGIESFGLRDPLVHAASVSEALWRS